MILIGFAFAAINGNIEVVTQAAFDGAATGVTVCFGLISVLVFWMGMMKMAEDAVSCLGLLSCLVPLWASCSPMCPKIIRRWVIFSPI